MNQTKDYKNLIGFLLGPVRKRPTMYIGESKISCLATFIIGYQVGFEMARSDESPTSHFADFLNWYEEKYELQKASFWQQYFLDETDQNESLALELFFNYLDEYNSMK